MRKFLIKSFLRPFIFLGGILCSLSVMAQIAGQFSQSDFSGGVGPSTQNQFSTSFALDFSKAGKLTLSEQKNWFDSNWLFRKAITINFENNPQSVKDYQVLVTDFDTSGLILDNKLKDNCEDLRLTNQAGDLLSFVVIEGTCDTTDTQIWVKVDKIAGGDESIIYIYYGNKDAPSIQSMEETFSYDQPKLVGFVVDPLIAQNGLNLISLESDNEVQLNRDPSVELGLQDLVNFNANDIEVGSEIKAKKLIHADGVGDGSDILTPISFAGNTFLHHAYRKNSHYTLYSHWGDADYEVYANGILVSEDTLDQGRSITINGINDNTAVLITSNSPVYVHHYALDPIGTIYDSVVLYPATSEDLFGISSANFSLSSGNHPIKANWINHEEAQGREVLQAHQVRATNVGGNQGSAGAYRFQGNRDFSVNQIEDGDGQDSTSFWPRKEMGTRFGGNNIVQYVAIATPNPRTDCTPINNAGAKAGATTSGGHSNFVNFIHFGLFDPNPNDSNWLAPGWSISCLKPVFAYYEIEDDQGIGSLSDERNLWSYPQMRQYVYPEPQIVKIGDEEFKFNKSGFLVSNIIDIGRSDVEWSILNLEGDILDFIDVRLRSGQQFDLSDAEAFINCDPVSDGNLMSANDCVSDHDRYIQFFIFIKLKGFNTPQLENIILNYHFPEPEPEPEPQPEPNPNPEPEPEPEPQPQPQPQPEPVPEPNDNQSDQSFSISASIGEDIVSLVGKPVPLVGQASSSSKEVTYAWSIIEGDGYLTHENTLNNTFFTEGSTPSQTVSIRFLVSDSQGHSAQDDVKIHLINPNDLIVNEYTGIITANELGFIRFDFENNSLISEKLRIIFPEDFSEDDQFNLHLTDDQRLVIGFPNDHDDQGKLYVSRLPITDLESTIDLNTLNHESSNDFYFTEGLLVGDQLGAYITSADLDGDDISEILVSSPHSGSSGLVSIVDPKAQVIDFILGDDGFYIDSMISKFSPIDDHYLIGFGPNYMGVNRDLQFFENFNDRGVQEITLISSSDLQSHFKVRSHHDEESIIAMSLGDLDDFPDLDLVLTSDTGLIYIFYNLSLDENDLSLSDASVILEAPSDDEAFGTSVQIGEVNGDPWGDLVFGAPQSGENQEGAVYVLFGSPHYLTSGKLKNHNRLLKIQPEDPEAQIGTDLLLVYHSENQYHDIYTINAYQEIIAYTLPLALGVDSDHSFDEPSNQLSPLTPNFRGAFGGGASCRLSPKSQISSQWGMILFGFPLLFFIRRRINFSYHE